LSAGLNCPFAILSRTPSFYLTVVIDDGDKSAGWLAINPLERDSLAWHVWWPSLADADAISAPHAIDVVIFFVHFVRFLSVRVAIHVLRIQNHQVLQQRSPSNLS
jgi:hypothetical protein